MNEVSIITLSPPGELKAISEDKLVFNLAENDYPNEGLLILRSDDIQITMEKPFKLPVNCYKGVVKEILPSEYGMEITVDAGEIFYVDISADTFKRQPVCESSEVWITFSREAGIALQGSN